MWDRSRTIDWQPWKPLFWVIGGVLLFLLTVNAVPGFYQPLAAGVSGLLVVFGLALAFLQTRIGREHPDVAPILVLVLISLFGGFFLVGGAVNFARSGAGDSAFRGAIGWALAYFACGFLVGFLFGIPRVLQGDGSPSSGANRTGQASSAYQQRVNTNLEQISDWLTKIIVGLGLVQLRSVPGYLYSASTWMSQSFSLDQGKGTTDAASFAGAFIVFFSVVGFLGGYLLTRLFLAGAFWRAEVQPVQVTTEASQVDDATVEIVRSFWRPSGAADPGNQKQLEDWLKKEGIQVSLPTFIYGKEFAADRQKAIQELKIIPISSSK